YLVLVLAAMSTARAVPAAQAQAPVIVEIELQDVVHPVRADYVKEGLDHAKNIGARAVILRINTPGGLIDSVREVAEAVLSAPVPVITWDGTKTETAAFNASVI